LIVERAATPNPSQQFANEALHLPKQEILDALNRIAQQHAIDAGSRRNSQAIGWQFLHHRAILARQIGANAPTIPGVA